MTPLQAEFHRAHLARQARMAAAAERHAKRRLEKMEPEQKAKQVETLLSDSVEQAIKLCASNGETVLVEPDQVRQAAMLLAMSRPSRITIDQVQRAVCEYYDLSYKELVSARRTDRVAGIRHVAMYLAKTLTLRSLPEIGRRFGGRDHTTVLHGVRKIARLIDEDLAIKTAVDVITSKLRPQQ